MTVNNPPLDIRVEYHERVVRRHLVTPSCRCQVLTTKASKVGQVLHFGGTPISSREMGQGFPGASREVGRGAGGRASGGTSKQSSEAEGWGGRSIGVSWAVDSRSGSEASALAMHCAVMAAARALVSSFWGLGVFWRTASGLVIFLFFAAVLSCMALCRCTACWNLASAFAAFLRAGWDWDGGGEAAPRGGGRGGGDTVTARGLGVLGPWPIQHEGV